MISMQVYPVMEGVEVWVAASCMSKLEGHSDHRGESTAFYISREDLDKRGILGALIHELEMVLSEQPLITERIKC